MHQIVTPMAATQTAMGPDEPTTQTDLLVKHRCLESAVSLKIRKKNVKIRVDMTS